MTPMFYLLGRYAATARRDLILRMEMLPSVLKEGKHRMARYTHRDTHYDAAVEISPWVTRRCIPRIDLLGKVSQRWAFLHP